MDLPVWNLCRKVRVSVKREGGEEGGKEEKKGGKEGKEGKVWLVCQGVERGTKGQMIPASIIRQARCVELRKKGGERKVLTPENGMKMEGRGGGGGEGFAVSMDFFGHYHEESFAFKVGEGEVSFVISLWFNPKVENEWHYGVEGEGFVRMGGEEFEKVWGGK